MDKVKKWVVDLAVPMLKAYINYGHGLEEDGVSVTAKGIEFLAEFEPGLYPMYAIELREYVEHMGIAIEDVQEIHLVAAAYDENEEEIDFSIEYEKCALVSEDELNGYSNSDILPTTNYKVIGSKEITKIKLTVTMDTKQMEFLFRIMSFTMQWGLTFSLRMANLAGFVN